ncbi:MAG TPA: formylglycine-generating enzyme family protein [Planctomycetaceae bacterium]|nr:formylglycine-generating enzyme family protein [Planctomycetaceae bacterium]
MREKHKRILLTVLLAVCSVASADKPSTAKRSRPACGGTRAGQVRDDNSLKMKLVWIQPGQFIMGSPKEEKDRGDDEAQVQVTLSKGFWLGQHEVTQVEWQRVMQTTPWCSKEFVKEGGDYPATYLSWYDAMKFCGKLTDQERSAGRLPSDWQYTLPTEAQWEYACRAGTKSRFSFGDDESDLSMYAWAVKNAWYADEKYAHRVGQKKANAWGLYDMHGNVWEWCRDIYARELPRGTDPEVSAGGADGVNRGGGLYDFARRCRSAVRFRNKLRDRYFNLGFRVALELSRK